MRRADFKPLIIVALRAYGGSARIHQVCEHVWNNNQARIMQSTQVLYTWQYDIRWAANQLRKENVISSNPRGNWTII